MRWSIVAAGGLLAAVAVLVWLAIALVSPASLLARHWQRQLARQPDDQLEPQLQRIAHLGAAGLPVLVEAMASDRRPLAEAAQTVLRREVDRWETIETPLATARAARLAELLAQHIDTFSRKAQATAADLATRMLLLPLDENAADTAQLIAHCETVLKVTGHLRQPAVAARAPRPAQAISEQGAGKAAHTATPAASAAPLPLESVAPEMLQIRMPQQIDSHQERQDGQRLPAAPLPEPTGEVSSGPQRFVPSASQPLEPDNRRPDSGDGTSPRQPTDLAGSSAGGRSPQLHAMSAPEVMRLLASEDALLALTAEDELRRRGWTDRALRLAYQFANPDPEVRRQLARLLPRATGVDGRTWLLWLAGDRDPRVRREAVSILATSGDPKIHEQLRKIAERETDGRVFQNIQLR